MIDWEKLANWANEEEEKSTEKTKKSVEEYKRLCEKLNIEPKYKDHYFVSHEMMEKENEKLRVVIKLNNV